MCFFVDIFYFHFSEIVKSKITEPFNFYRLFTRLDQTDTKYIWHFFNDFDINIHINILEVGKVASRQISKKRSCTQVVNKGPKLAILHMGDQIRPKMARWNVFSNTKNL